MKKLLAEPMFDVAAMRELLSKSGKARLEVQAVVHLQACNAMLSWRKDNKIDWRFIQPGKPMQSGFIGSC